MLYLYMRRQLVSYTSAYVRGFVVPYVHFLLSFIRQMGHTQILPLMSSNYEHKSDYHRMGIAMMWAWLLRFGLVRAMKC